MEQQTNVINVLNKNIQYCRSSNSSLCTQQRNCYVLINDQHIDHLLLFPTSVYVAFGEEM